MVNAHSGSDNSNRFEFAVLNGISLSYSELKTTTSNRNSIWKKNYEDMKVSGYVKFKMDIRPRVLHMTNVNEYEVLHNI